MAQETTHKTEQEHKKEAGDGSRSNILIIGGVVLGLLALAVGLYYVLVVQTRISIDKSEVSAPVINLAPANPGVLKELYVSEGDTVLPFQPVARVGDALIKTQTGGIVISVQNTIGEIFAPSQTVVQMIDPSKLRIVGHLDEDKGLDQIHVGQDASFTVDAFPGKKFDGTVYSISEATHQNDVVFNISDKREVKQFDIKIGYDQNAYPELKQGMSAKIVIYKK